ncbi:hypothetical protein [Haliangium ochraceum]|uniref:Preprotein translocase subunit YajC n=1 Tax=Haliangium ochraceum (strain DSM 14365 / JCM 11303 / SMP-2) TaxID=502025 RepID=D0LWK0_HALO1|nr:hypothetical protein [Haliangium ochraceum]ACY17650.1 hypothetical protein Hoch_5162 [Haliangium ochraceum DSM 14365]
MSLTSTKRAAFVLSLLWLAPAHAQSEGGALSDRFASNKVRGEAETGAVVQGQISSSTMFYTELGETIVNGASELADNASPIARLFTELRAQLTVDLDPLSDSAVRVDARGRFNLPCAFTGGDSADLAEYDACRTQSGSFGQNEYDIRELYYRMDGDAVDLVAGRQYITEAGAAKVDGVKVMYPLDSEWTLLGFGGLYPSRISRSVADDYAGPTLPVIAGAGGAYAYERFFGSLGAAGIIPIDASGDVMAPAPQPRVFVTSNGYWRPTDQLDVYHFAVIDAVNGAADEVSDQFSNLSLGINARPMTDLRLSASLHHYSTETLDEFARQRLDLRGSGDYVQNNIEVLRMSSQAARLGASLALSERRFEVSTSFEFKRRLPETVCLAGGGDFALCAADDQVSSEDTWSGEGMLSFVDRQSVGGFRLGARIINAFGLYELGLGEQAVGRSNYLIARIDGSRPLMDDRAQFDLDLSYLHAEDVGTTDCTGDAFDCYGSSVVDTITGTGTFYYRFLPDWYALATASLGLQSFEAPDINDRNARAAYANTLLTAYLRLAYRF